MTQSPRPDPQTPSAPQQLDIIKVTVDIPEPLDFSRYHCPACDLSAASARVLLAHSRNVHHLPSVLLYRCTHCSVSYATEFEARRCSRSHLSAFLSSMGAPIQKESSSSKSDDKNWPSELRLKPKGFKKTGGSWKKGKKGKNSIDQKDGESHSGPNASDNQGDLTLPVAFDDTVNIELEGIGPSVLQTTPQADCLSPHTRSLQCIKICEFSTPIRSYRQSVYC